jgi:hypothetical protein
MNTLISRRFGFSICGFGAIALILFGGSASAITIRTVTQNGNDGPGSLRQAITNSAAGDIINFSVTGAITLSGSTLMLTQDILISGPGARKLNVTAPNGTVFYIASGNVTMTGLTIGPGNFGINLTAGTLTMNDCAVSGNAPFGGMFTHAGTTLNMNGCTISGNQLNSQGGAGLQNQGTAILTNCTVAGNTSTHTMGFPSGEGGGVLNNQGSVTLRSCTVTGNTAESIGGGIANPFGGVFQLANTIVANNTSPVAPDGEAGFLSNGYNLIGIKDGSTGFTNNVNHDIVGTAASPRDSLLLPLQDNGGATDTAAMFASASPAFNAGNPANAPARDQRDFLRPDAPDIGACEFLGTQPVTLANISSRAVVQTADNVLIGGFIITGTRLKKVILRAIGPSLNLPGKLQDPILDLYNSSSQLVASNDDWQDAPNAQEISATTIAPTNSLESAILLSLGPGTYTAVVRGFRDGTGIGVVEAYDLDRTVNSRLANISTRAAVQTGDNALIGGFIVLGPDSMTAIIRAIGPSLNVPNHMLDPRLELHDGNGATLAINDNWRTSQEAEIIATGVPPTSDAESAIIRTLPPGNYTAIVSGTNNTAGVAVVEIYGLLPQ